MVPTLRPVFTVALRLLVLAALGVIPVAGASAGQDPRQDAAPGGSKFNPTPLALGDVLVSYDVEAVTTPPANVSLGVEFAEGHYWVTGRSLDDDIKKLFKLAPDGTLVAEYPQDPCPQSVFGWRDLAYDGASLYAADECGIDQISTKDGSISGTCPNPPAIGLARALAHDPASGNFWSANFRSNIVEFEMCGGVVQSLPNTADLAIYGFGWDDVSADGPYLWAFSQDGAPEVLASQLTTAGTLTGVSFVGASIGGMPIAGGADVDCDAVSGTLALVTLHQAMTDTIVVYDLDVACGSGSKKE